MLQASPLSPAQAKALQHESIPGFVFEECNRLITAGLSFGRATVSVPDLVQAIRKRMAPMPEYREVCDAQSLPSHWVSSENIRRTYEPAGWKVEYDRPAYYESGEAKFFFTERR